MTTRYRLTIAYLGTRYCGWQRQRSAPTVQAEVERAVSRIIGAADATVVGSGRTDAGVHAAAQVAHVDLPHEIPAEGLAKALNGALPDDIRIRAAAVVHSSFHARFSAAAKHYAYRARWSHTPSLAPWSEARRARVREITDQRAVEECVASCVGRHDWASFTVARPETGSTKRRLYDLRIHFERGGFRLDAFGEGFLRYQVRRMTGALLEVGWARRDSSWFVDLVRDPRPGAPVCTAAARGLTLEHVYYRAPHCARCGGPEGAAPTPFDSRW